MWYAAWRFAAAFRGFCFQILGGSFFEQVGRGTKFFGWPSFGTCNGNVALGTNCLIGRGVFFSSHRDSRIEIGNGCSLNTGCHLIAVYGITIGDGTRIGEFCSIRDQNHNFADADQSVSEQGFVGGKVTVGKNCWIGRGVFIGPGVTIGDGSVVGANAVVVKDVAPFDVVAGVPAKVIGKREGS